MPIGNIKSLSKYSKPKNIKKASKVSFILEKYLKKDRAKTTHAMQLKNMYFFCLTKIKSAKYCIKKVYINKTSAKYGLTRI